MLHWLIKLKRMATSVMEMVSAWDYMGRGALRETSDMRKEGRGLVMVTLITRYHKPSSWKSVVLNFIPVFISSVSCYCRLLFIRLGLIW